MRYVFNLVLIASVLAIVVLAVNKSFGEIAAIVSGLLIPIPVVVYRYLKRKKSVV